MHHPHMGERCTTHVWVVHTWVEDAQPTYGWCTHGWKMHNPRMGGAHMGGRCTQCVSGWGQTYLHVCVGMVSHLQPMCVGMVSRTCESIIGISVQRATLHQREQKLEYEVNAIELHCSDDRTALQPCHGVYGGLWWSMVVYALQPCHGGCPISKGPDAKATPSCIQMAPKPLLVVSKWYRSNH